MFLTRLSAIPQAFSGFSWCCSYATAIVLDPVTPGSVADSSCEENPFDTPIFSTANTTYYSRRFKTTAGFFILGYRYCKYCKSNSSVIKIWRKFRVYIFFGTGRSRSWWINEKATTTRWRQNDDKRRRSSAPVRRRSQGDASLYRRFAACAPASSGFFDWSFTHALYLHAREREKERGW